MTKEDTIQMMRRCANEIENLRREIDRLQPRADAYDSIRQILSLLPRPSQGYGEDLVWKLRAEIKKLEAAAKTTEPQP